MSERKWSGAAFPCEGGPASGLASDPGMEVWEYCFIAAVKAMIPVYYSKGDIKDLANGILGGRVVAQAAAAQADAMVEQCEKGRQPSQEGDG